MKKIILVSLFAASLQLMGTGCNDSNSSTTTVTKEDTINKMVDDKKDALQNNMNDAAVFIKEAAMGGMMEVELGKLAQTNAAGKDIKDFGKMMETDHAAANAELQSIASSKNIMLPASLGEEQNMEMKNLAEKKGTDFDKAYISMMVDDHVKDVDAFKNAASYNKDIDVKNFADKTLPTLQKHLDRAKVLNAKMKM